MPLDPATIRATAQRVVDEWRATAGSRTERLWVLLVQTGADLAAQSHATAHADAEREAEFVKLAQAAHDALQGTSFIYDGSPGVARLVIARVFPKDHAALLAFKRLAREYPAPRECVLSDGSVVTYGGGTLHRAKGNEPRAGATLRSWFCLLSPEHTGADWDALKSFATTEGAR